MGLGHDEVVPVVGELLVGGDVAELLAPEDLLDVPAGLVNFKWQIDKLNIETYFFFFKLYHYNMKYAENYWENDKAKYFSDANLMILRPMPSPLVASQERVSRDIGLRGCTSFPSSILPAASELFLFFT